MQSAPELRVLGDLHPNQYRETPIYSGPRSPAVTRAYFSEEDICLNCPPPGSSCEELCIIKDYSRDEDSNSSASADDFADCAESFDERSDAQSWLTSHDENSTWESSRYSELSIKCRGEQLHRRTGIQHSDQLNPPISPPVDCYDIRSSQDHQIEPWIDSDSSRCSSRVSITEFCDASATPLSAAKPLVVELYTQTPPPIYPPEVSSLSFQRSPRSTPLGWASRKMTVLESPPITPKDKIIEVPTSIPGFGSTFLHPPTPVLLPLDGTMETPPISPLAAAFRSELNYTRSVPRHRFDVNEISEGVLAIPLIEEICDAIDGSPRDLQLDTFCINEIRRQNRQARNEPASSLTSPNLSCIDPETFLHVPRGGTLHRRKSLFSLGPLRHAVSHKSRHPTTGTISASTIRNGPSASTSTTTSADHKSADLQPLYDIFPESDDWWRGVLYSHLVAYNYVRDVCQARRPAAMRRLIHSKAVQTLGLPPAAMMVDLPADLQWEESGYDQSFAEIQSGLASCINRIISCMAGDYEGMRDHLEGLTVRHVNHAFVRALAEVVRSCEKRIAREPDPPGPMWHAI
ncbi:MAG: hypothetical protein M1818_001515 [Claussenomyces sp. TS43310]|nr:MAG: hypothetical protein M1818_001515 [Claussenomyces sp. TS43310]